MPKPSSENLYLLIKSLTKEEKRNFKLYINRYAESDSGLYVKVFDAIEKADNNNESAIIRQLNIRHFNKLKSRLYIEILDCLAFYNRNETVQFTIRTLITQSDILRKKTLLKQADELLRRAEKLAVKFDFSLLHVLILQKRFYYLQFNATKKKAPVVVNSVIGQINTSLVKQGRRTEFMKTSAEIDNYIRFSMDNEKMKEFLQAKIRAMEKMSVKEMGFQEKSFLYESLFLFYSKTGNLQKAYEYMKLCLLLHLDNPHIINEYPAEFISGAAGNYLYLCIELHKWNDFLKMHKLISSLNYSTGQSRERYLYIIDAHLIEYYIIRSEFKKAIARIKELEKVGLKSPSYEMIWSALTFYFKCGYVFFLSGDSLHTRLWLNKILVNKQFLNENLYLLTRVLLLINAFEIKDFRYFDKNVQPLLKELKLKKTFTNELNVIESLSSFYKRNGQVWRRTHLTEELKKIKQLSDERAEVGSYYNLGSWIKERTLRMI